MPEGGLPELTIGGRTFVLVLKEDYERLAQGSGSTPPLSGTDLGRALRVRRRRAGLTQAALAERAGIRLETLSRIENGRGNPTVGTVKAILDGLDGRAEP
jgi:DNA-binding XRE family transcriptional regulator